MLVLCLLQNETVMTCEIIHDWQPRECDCVYSTSCLFSFYTAGRRKQPRKHGHLQMSRLLRGYVATSVCQQSSMHLPANHAYKMEIQHFVLAGAYGYWMQMTRLCNYLILMHVDQFWSHERSIRSCCCEVQGFRDRFVQPKSGFRNHFQKKYPLLHGTAWHQVVSVCKIWHTKIYYCTVQHVLNCLILCVIPVAKVYPSTCASLGACPWRQEVQPAAPHFEGIFSLSLAFFFHLISASVSHADSRL